MGAAEGQLGSREYSQAGNVQAAEYLYRRLASYGLNVWYEDFIADNGRLLLNVVGEIPGQDQSKIYLMTAHFDSIADDTKDPVLAPGALDNASGDSVLLETARALSGYTLQYSVHFAFFNGEEYALQGAHAFAHNAETVESRPYAGAFNVDSVGAALDQNQLYVNANQSSQFLSNLLVDINDRWGLGVAVWPSMSEKIKADDTELNNFGIPAVMVGAVLYGDPLINNSKDTIQDVDMWYLQAVGQLMTIAMATLVMPGG
jgi:Zn-dependent M28 family amino/carboxypeptidase